MGFFYQKLVLPTLPEDLITSVHNGQSTPLILKTHSATNLL
jgi:hypothetical protein